jgi:hypothetical protein
VSLMSVEECLQLERKRRSALAGLNGRAEDVGGRAHFGLRDF